MPVAGEFDRIHTLANGMQIAVLPFAKKSRVHVWLCVKTGLWDGFIPKRNPEKGLPTIVYETKKGKPETLVFCPAVDHGTEHVIFKGTEDPRFRTPLQVVKFYGPRNRDDEEAQGAETQILVVPYYTEVQPEELELAVRFLSALTLRSLLKRNDRATKKRFIREWEKEHKVMRHEKGWDNDEGVWVTAVEKTRQRMFPGHPLAYTLDGEEKELLALTLADVRARYRMRYHPANMLLIVIGGGTTPATAKKLAQKYFRSPRRKFLPIPVPKPQFHLNAPIKERVEFIAQSRDKVYIALGFPFQRPWTTAEESSSISIKKHCSILILKKIFGGRWASRPFVELREKRGVGYRHNAELYEFPGAGALIYTTHLFPEETYESLRILFRIFKKLATKLLYEEEFDHAKRAIVDELNSAAETPGDLAEFIYRWMRLAGKIPMFDELKRVIAEITREDIMEVAREIIAPEKLYATFIGNLPGEKIQRLIRRFIQNWKLTK